MIETRLMELIFFVSLDLVVSVFGVATNVINIIIFFKQGFSDSLNISFCVLAISDIGANIPLIWKSICFNPLFQYSDIGFNSAQVQYITAAWPHGCFVRITSWITAFITFERCVCIALPLKVKDIITHKRTLVTIAVIFILISASVVPVFSAVNISLKFNVQRNITLFELTYSNNNLHIENISFNINVFEQLFSFIVIIICTVILICNLIVVSQRRHNFNFVSSSLSLKSMSSRDTRVMKMITSISCIFIACFLPGTVNMLVMIYLSPEYRIGGRYESSYQNTWTVVSLLEAINCSVSILVYYMMSSKFRTSFNDLFITRLKCKH